MSTNISKQKREDLLNKIKEIWTFIASAPQDENTGNLLSYLSDLEKDVNGKKYGLVFDEIFGYQNFIANVIWEKKFSPQNDVKWLSDSHDHILLYANDKEIWHPALLSRTQEMDSRYSNPDNDPRGPWVSSDFTVKTASEAYMYILFVLLESATQMYLTFWANKK